MPAIINELSPFGRYVKEKLMTLNKTQRWLSQQVRIDTATLSNMIRGTLSHPDKEAAVKKFLEKYEQK